ncbi:unnamed protein product [Zymoseptoria tritici ST99CH_1E4]|uniref:Telomeric single stranded DNA binding POT1/Cdc13 domain-containing protein n=2 Tax=Zymoseptoria tritici TaxID=1047171 RepID=A0A2H1G4C8_ZYMTR|nr:unnamed protein product [Zymoseptoria tritici ST99CH_1E4]
MASRNGSVLFLAGAPNADDLDWAETDLNQRLQSPIRRFLADNNSHDDTTVTATQIALTTASHPLAKWREIPLDNDIHNDIKTRPAQQKDKAAFLACEPGSQAHNLFLEHSLAQLHSLEQGSSQLFPSPLDATTTFISNPSFSISSFSSSAQNSSSSPTKSFQPGPPSAPIPTLHPPHLNVGAVQITPLSHLPTARTLQVLHPQTPTVNLLASIISIQPPRTVSLRRYQPGKTMEIVELILGDDTRAGFGVSFWLDPIDSQARPTSRGGAGAGGGKDEMRVQLEVLRRGDVVLFTNVALKEWKGNVFGQSLGRKITTKNATTVWVFKEGEEVDGEVGRKIGRVREWARKFVGGGREGECEEGTKAPLGKRKRDGSLLPPETQEFEMVR